MVDWLLRWTAILQASLPGVAPGASWQVTPACHPIPPCAAHAARWVEGLSSGTLFLRHLLSLIHLGLLSFQETAGGGLVFWHPQGARVRSIIEDYWRARHREAGYELLFTPHIAKLDLWKTSGHFDFYKENMFDQVGGGWEEGEERRGGERR